MGADEGTSLQDQLDRFVGASMGPSAPSVGPDPVNQPMIRHWAAAFDDRNPVYSDPDVAAASRFGGIVAPPLMLQTWTMPPPLIAGIAERGGSPVASTDTGPLQVLDDAGFVGTLAANSELEFERYLRIGDEVSATTSIESISQQKQTRLGPGHFVTWITTYRDGAGDVVGRQLFRILKFAPTAAADG